MKKIIAITILLAVLLQTFSQLVIVADYYTHKDYIARNLCENRNNPALHCEGKCCLKKKLDRDNRQQTPSPSRQKIQQAPVFNLFMPATVFSISRATHIGLKQKYFLRDDRLTDSFPHAVFHPPAA